MNKKLGKKNKINTAMSKWVKAAITNHLCKI